MISLNLHKEHLMFRLSSTAFLLHHHRNNGINKNPLSNLYSSSAIKKLLLFFQSEEFLEFLE